MPMLFLYAQLPPRFFSMFYVLHGSLRDYLFLGIKKRPTSIRPYILSQAQVRVKSFFNLLEKSEVEVVRTRITLACTECKQRN